MSDDMRKFFRYVMPGLVYSVITLVLFLIALPESTIRLLTNPALKDNIGVVVAAFFVSGGIGYVFATFHHWVRWHLGCDEDVLNSRKFLLTLDGKFITLDPDERKTIESGNNYEARRQAEATALAEWFKLLKKDEPGKDQNDVLGNQAHGLGTTRIAAAFALLTLIVSMFYDINASTFCGTVRPYIAATIVGVIIIFLFHDAYTRVAYLAQYTFEKLLREELEKKKNEEEIKRSNCNERSK